MVLTDGLLLRPPAASGKNVKLGVPGLAGRRSGSDGIYRVRFGPGVGVSLGGAGPTWFEGDVPRATRTARVTLVARERGRPLALNECESRRWFKQLAVLKGSRPPGLFFRYLSQNTFVVNQSESRRLPSSTGPSSS